MLKSSKNRIILKVRYIVKCPQNIPQKWENSFCLMLIEQPEAEHPDVKCIELGEKSETKAFDRRPC